MNNIGWIYPFIIVGGIMQACGAPMNGQLKASLRNPWLASTVSFAVIAAFFFCAFVVIPRPLPAVKDLASMPWWAPLGGLVGAVQVYAGLTLVNRVGAGPFMGFTVTAALITSVVIDHFGWFQILGNRDLRRIPDRPKASENRTTCHERLWQDSGE